MSKQEIANAVLESRQIRYEELEALSCGLSDVLKLLNGEKIFQLLGFQYSTAEDTVIEQLANQKIIYRNNGHFSITNLGAIVGAKDFRQFPGKERLPVRVVKYRGTSKIETESEKEFFSGYGVGFQELIQYVISQLPTSEIIKDALRKTVSIYPEITIRELVANALIHRDFSITTMSPMVEIFSDRMEITNPRALLPSVKLERIIDSAPESRNEIFASMMRRMGICEERGSGIDKALFYVELFGLPPIGFMEGPNTFKAVLYQPRTFKEMSQDERLRSCYQHCCLKHVSGERMTNTSFRKRLGLGDGQYVLAWRGHRYGY